VKAYLLADPLQAEIPFETTEAMTLLKLPKEQPDPFVSVVILEYESYPATVNGLAAQSVYGGYSLTPLNATLLKGNTMLQAPSRFGTFPSHIEVKEKSEYQWRLFVDKPKSLYADISYNYQGEQGKGTVSVKSDTGSLSARFQSTGEFVGEPNSNWQIGSFNAHRLGKLDFPEPGYYDITLEVKPQGGEKVDFQWLWLGEY
jgi:alpha-L-fucosidase